MKIARSIVRSVILVLALLFVGIAKADANTTVDFTVTILNGSLGGPEAGQVYTGSFTYDTNDNKLLSFNFDDPAWSGHTLSSPDGFYSASYIPYNGLYFFYAPYSVSTDNSFSVGNGVSATSFSYGTGSGTSGIGCCGAFEVEGYGDVTYSGIPPIPEPSSIFLLGGGLVGLIGVVRRQNRQRSSPVAA